MKGLDKRLTRMEAATGAGRGEWPEPEEGESTGHYLLRVLRSGVTLEELVAASWEEGAADSEPRPGREDAPGDDAAVR